MDNRKIGYVGLGLLGLFGIFYFVCSHMENAYLASTLLSTLGYTIILVCASFWLMINGEHEVVPFIDIVVALGFLGISIIKLLLSSKDIVNMLWLFNFNQNFTTMIMFINVPLLINSQSHIHKIYKNVLVFVIIVVCLVTFINSASLRRIADSATAENFTDVQSRLESYKKKTEFIETLTYITAFAVILSPAIGLATSDGIGFSTGGVLPSLVPRNIATDPNMVPNNSISNSINYGNLPVPDGVVANKGINQVLNQGNSGPGADVSKVPSIEEQVNSVATEVKEEVNAPVEELKETPASNSNVVDLSTQAPKEEKPAPTTNVEMKASDVAPELQFLLNGEDNKN